MFKDREFFMSLTPTQGQVILGDSKTAVSIHGVGTVTCRIGQDIFKIEDVHYVPDLGESIYSLFCHIQCPHHSLYSSYEGCLYIILPNFQRKVMLGKNDVYLDIEPVHPVDDSGTSSSSSLQNDMFCCSLKNFATKVTKETNNLDNLLKRLHRYYKEIKTKRQLNLYVPEILGRNLLYVISYEIIILINFHKTITLKYQHYLMKYH